MDNQVTIDYSKRKRIMRRVGNRERVDLHYLGRCVCGNEWYIRFDAIKHTHSCKVCAQHVRSKKGYAATAAKYGVFFALRWLREWRLNTPTNLERIVASWLDELGVSYEREYWLESADGVSLVDFMVSGGALAIEANGTYWHDMEHAVERDARKAETLRYSGIPLLTLSEDDVLSGRGFEIVRAEIVKLGVRHE